MSQNFIDSDARIDSNKLEELDNILENLKKIKTKEQENLLKTLPKKYIEVLYKKLNNSEMKFRSIDKDSDSNSMSDENQIHNESIDSSGEYDNSYINRKQSKQENQIPNRSNLQQNSPQLRLQSTPDLHLQTNLNKFLIQMSNSKKPLWIEDVKRTCEKFIPQVDMKDLENTKDILVKEEQEEIFLNHEDYPYFHTVRKLMYAFGDVYKNNSRTVLYVHDFFKRLLITLAKIINECEFKKVLEHLYSYEFHKYFNYKKLKFKNNFEIEEDLAGDVGNDGDVDYNQTKDSQQIKQRKNNSYEAFELGDGMQIDELVEISDKENCEVNQSHQPDAARGADVNKNYLENIFEEKDEDYFENLEFQDQRTSTMNHSEYLEFISCRHQTFLTKGKKTFLNFLQNILQNHFAFELRDSNNLELISFLMKEILRKIVTSSIKNKFPGAEKKLYILNFPLVLDDIEEFCNKETEKLESFLADFYTDIYLIKEFKKKKFNKKNNKNVKIKKKEDEFVIIVKKLIYLDDEKQIEFLRKEKKNSEEKVLILQKTLYETYNEIKKTLKMKLENSKETKCTKNKDELAGKTRAKSTKSQKEKSSKVKTNPRGENNSEFVFELNITNFYEHFLVKDYLIPDLSKRVNEVINLDPNTDYSCLSSITGLSEEINKKLNMLKKLSRKTLTNKFSQWLKLSSGERNYLIEQFESTRKNSKNIHNTVENKLDKINSKSKSKDENIFEDSENSLSE